MNPTSDPFERLRAANPVPSAPPTDWVSIREHLHSDPHDPRERRSRPTPRSLAGTGSGILLALVAMLALAMSGTLGSRGTSPGTRSAVSRCGHGGACFDTLRRLAPPKGLSPLTGGGLVSAPRLSEKPVAARSCSVIGPRCVQGCAVPVAGLQRARHALAPAPAAHGCSAKTPERPCLEDIAGASTNVPAPTGARSCPAPSLRQLDKRIFRPFPHRTSRRH